jgi:hypothetical protein
MVNSSPLLLSIIQFPLKGHLTFSTYNLGNFDKGEILCLSYRWQDPQNMKVKMLPLIKSLPYSLIIG